MAPKYYNVLCVYNAGFRPISGMWTPGGQRERREREIKVKASKYNLANLSINPIEQFKE